MKLSKKGLQKAKPFGKPKQVITNSLKQSFKTIQKNKYLFIILFFTQILFIVILASIFTYYAIDVSEHAQAIIEPLQQSALEQGDITNLYQNPEEIYQEYRQMINSILMFFLLSYLCYIIINGINWDITNLIITKVSRFLHYQSMFALLTILFTIPAMLIINILSKLFISIELSGASIILGAIILLIALYFMYISFSLINKYKISQIKELLKQTYKIGIKNPKLLLPTYAIMIAPTAISFILIYLTLEANIILLTLITILFILSINWARIYFLTTMEEIVK